MKRVRHIALLMNQDLGFCRDVLRGVRAYGIQNPHWVFHNGPPDLQVIPLLQEWNPDGIIAELFDPQFARRLLRLRKPVIDTAYWLPHLKAQVVDVDHDAVGQLAADYLISLGLTNFAYFGSESAQYSLIRQRGFQRQLQRHGFEPIVCHQEYLHEASRTTSWKQMESHISRTLRKLPKPLGVFVCNDVMARRLSDACQHLGIQVPDEVALLGVDNDELECLLTSPPLSSIAIPGERIGYEAAKQLERAMRSKRIATGSLFLPPVRVVARQSTDTMAINDPDIIAALQYIRAHIGENINVADVVRAICVSRRALERKFSKVLGRTILQELLRMRIEHTKKLLASTSLPMPAIAKLSGFSSAHRLAIVFHRICGTPPTEYRRQSQLRDA